MERLNLHEFHASLGGRFGVINGAETVEEYGDRLAEHKALTETAGLLDLSCRSRICLTGADRMRFLHGQVTNDIKKLKTGQGCYAAVVSAKGRMQSDLNIYNLTDELLLDFEPGLSGSIIERLKKYIVADDVEVIDVTPIYGLISVEGQRAATVVQKLGIFGELPGNPFEFSKTADSELGEMYLINQPRFGAAGFDLFVPVEALHAAANKLLSATRAVGGRPCGLRASEAARIEAGIPRFGLDMDETNLPQECGLEDRAVSYTKGCYIGQEVLNRVHTMGHVNRMLRGLQLPGPLITPPEKGTKLFHDRKEVGFITSAVQSPRWGKNIGLGYVRRGVDQPGTMLSLADAAGESSVRVVPLPFQF